MSPTKMSCPRGLAQAVSTVPRTESGTLVFSKYFSDAWLYSVGACQRWPQGLITVGFPPNWLEDS